jgi:transcriptional regulator PpsR
MNIAFSPKGTLPFRSPEDALGISRSALANRVLTVAGDVTFIIDSNNVIRDVALGSNAIGEQWVPEWLDKPWLDTVTVESKPKITMLLEQARSDAQPKWRQINHISDLGEIPVRYLTLSADDEGRVIAIGRDMRAEAMLQQRLLQAQQSIERDYVKMRQAESRYRMLFELSSEAVLVVETGTRRIADANPAACAMVASTAKALTGQPVANLFAVESRETAIALLGSVAAAEQAKPATVRLASGDAEFSMAASLFRQDRGSCFLVRLVARDVQMRMMDQADKPLFDVLDNMPDGFVVTDDSLLILAENAAFLDMVQVPRKEQVRGQPLSRFLGRPGIDLNLLVAQLREHGAARNFATVLRGLYEDQDEVEVSAVSVSDGGAERFGFSIRVVARRLAAIPAPMPGLAHSVEQMTELVGRVPLKEIVRESTDLIERLCIEAALAFTADNRASAAEILGLSRQSLYSKLHRHGLGNLGDDSSGD